MNGNTLISAEECARRMLEDIHRYFTPERIARIREEELRARRMPGYQMDLFDRFEVGP